MTPFISHEQAEQIANWERKHPEEAKAFQKFHRRLYSELRGKKITIEEFIKKHEEYRKKKK
jgi:hypothetical protein